MREIRFDVLGAEGAKHYFSRLEPASLSHGYLFSGGQGIGKKTFARRLAQSLLCEISKPGLLGYCGECSACRLVQAESHPDIFISSGLLKIGDRESVLTFHQSDEMTARDLVRQLSLSSYSGGWRIFILGDVDFATPHAANALLKFIEEPPPHVLLLLTTATPGRLIETIRSRLIELRFAPLRAGEVERVLRGQGVDARDAARVAALCGGSAARALASLEEGERSVRAEAIAWFFEIVEGGVGEAAWANREALDDGLETVKTLVRDWIVLSISNNEGRVLTVDEQIRLRALPALKNEDATRVLASLAEARELARTNVRPELVAEGVRMHLSGLATKARPRRTASQRQRPSIQR
ncbi:MAG: hypothetical protein M3Z14_01510 [Candidatus Eremiobacteraeota bacterium]|nr:hypothetical protein [Candidatus Eremiobacteraeota bacterium]